MQLNKVQETFKDTILDHPDALESPDQDFAALFENGDIPLSKRLSVYRNNIVGSLTDVMLATFPAIEKLVGKEFAEGMARSFVLESPPSQGCLHKYGHDFAEFIENFEPAKSLPYLADIARLELAMNDAYYAKDDTALSQEELASIPGEELSDTHLKLRDCVKLIASPYPLHDIRDFAMSDGEGQSIDIGGGKAFLMTYRPKLDTEIIILDEAEFAMLSHLQSGKALGEAVENTINLHEDFDFGPFLQKHLFLGTFLTLSSNI